ncbi:MAG TPA: hypothetical protein VL463_22485 [Kofleriaceae bacterium]|jgi:hypothetical protein|nr:hypothetical protein [Kofleriaceae bacterium]
MKVQCDLCKEIVVAGLSIRGDEIAVHCPACDGTFTVGTSAAPAQQKDVAPPKIEDGPTMTCPKCGVVQRPADACRSCGLLASRMPDFVATEDLPAAEVAAGWAACEAAWNDNAAHEALARLASAHNAYAYVARRYRERVKKNADDSIAAGRLAAITRMTEASLRAGATARNDRAPLVPGAPPRKPYRASLTVLVMLVVLVAAGTVYALVTTPTEEPAAAPIPVQPAH